MSLHLLVFMMYICTKGHVSKPKKLSKLKTRHRKFSMWLFKKFTFQIYIQFVIVWQTMIMMNTINEIIYFSTHESMQTDTSAIISLIFAIFVLVMSQCFYMLALYYYFKQGDRVVDGLLSEFSTGLKKTKSCQMYAFITLLRKSLFVV